MIHPTPNRLAARRVVQAMAIAILAALIVSKPAAQSSGADTFSMALTGNSLITRPLSPYTEPQFLGLIKMIRDADVAMTVVESGFNDYESYAMTEVNTYMRAAPAVAKDLAWAGFDMVALATNHADNFGVAGARLTRKYVAE